MVILPRHGCYYYFRGVLLSSASQVCVEDDGLYVPSGVISRVAAGQATELLLVVKNRGQAFWGQFKTHDIIGKIILITHDSMHDLTESNVPDGGRIPQ